MLNLLRLVGVLGFLTCLGMSQVASSSNATRIRGVRVCNIAAISNGETLVYDSAEECLKAGSALENPLTGAATTIATDDLDPNLAVISNGDGKIAVATVTSTQLENFPTETLNVRDFGAVCDGATDDTEAIQLALDAAKPSAGPVTGTSVNRTKVYFPQGTCVISEPLLVYSRQIISGEGRSSVITTSEDFLGSAILLAQGVSANQMFGFELGHLTFISTEDIPVFAQDTDVITINSKFHDLYFNTKHGLVFENYLQHSVIERVYSWGAIDKFLWIEGNDNLIQNVDKEGTSGTGSEAYITVAGHGIGLGSSDKNVFRNILLEGGCSANKVPFLLDNANNTEINSYWMECDATNGYALHVKDSNNVLLNGNFRLGTSVYGKLNFENSSAYMELLNTDAEATGFEGFLNVDSDSYLHIDTVYSRQNLNTWRLARNNITVSKYVARLALSDPKVGFSPTIFEKFQSRKILGTNTDFSSGDLTGWTWTSSQNSVTAEVVASALTSGNMVHFECTGGCSLGIHALSQNLSITSDMVGIPITISAVVKLTEGYAQIVPSGVGISTTGYIYRFSAGLGWGVLRQTIIPQEAGTLTFGIRFGLMTSSKEAWLDEVQINLGY